MWHNEVGFKSVSNGPWRVHCDALVCSKTDEYWLLIKNVLLLYYKMLLLFPVNSSKVPFEENFPVAMHQTLDQAGFGSPFIMYEWLMKFVTQQERL